MGYSHSRSARFHGDIDNGKPTRSCKAKSNILKRRYTSVSVSGSKIFPEEPCRSSKAKVLSRVFSEDYESVKEEKKWIFDPRGPLIHRWNKIFLAACLVSLFVDPLFFYLPGTREVDCIEIGSHLKLALTLLRTIADVFYVIQIFFRFRTAFVAPSSHVFGRGELVIDPSKIALRYLSKAFWFDLVAALPINQLLIWVLIPNLTGSTTANTKTALRFSVIFQYLQRFSLIFPLSSEIVKTTVVMTETAWAGAAYNLALYILVSHVVGASWYLLSIERQEACWREACRPEFPSCQYQYLDCRSLGSSRDSWFQSSNITNFCNPSNGLYQFGIYANAVNNNVTSSPFLHKYLYCFWWGLQNLSCLGQTLSTSMYVGENVFAIIIAILGLVLFGLLIGNMQSYLLSATARLEEWRSGRMDTEQWMQHRRLPPELKQRVRKYDQYKWVATRGVDEERLITELPLDLHRDIKRHLCLDLIRRVPLFDEMDDRMLDAICERLRPSLHTSGTFLVQELDPVSEMLFIIRGHLESFTTDGGRAGFFNSAYIGPGHFCGEELLTWALLPSSAAPLPSSTRTVRAISEVEAFALAADDLRFVAAQFRRLHSKQVRHKFRFYSHHWRMWAACFIQAAWRRHARQRVSMEMVQRGDLGRGKALERAESRRAAGQVLVFVARLLASVKGGTGSEVNGAVAKSLKKPVEPDFSEGEEG